MLFRVLPTLITLMSGDKSLQCFYMTRRSKSWSQGRKRIDMILNIYQLWQAEWGFTGIFCFTRIEVLIISSTVNYQKVKFLKNEIICVSHLYAKVVVFSKVPLPNYRFDLDDKRPQREVFSHNSVSLAVPFCMHFSMHHYTAINVHCRVQCCLFCFLFLFHDVCSGPK